MNVLIFNNMLQMFSPIHITYWCVWICFIHVSLVFFPFRACYGVLRFIMESGAKGCEVVVSGKLRGQRAKSMKFVDGLMIHSGDPINDYVDTAVRHVLLRQGIHFTNMVKVFFMLLYYHPRFQIIISHTLDGRLHMAH